MADSQTASALRQQISIRRAVFDDLDRVTALDAKVTGLAKPDYWQDIFDRSATRRLDERFFLVAETPADTAPDGAAQLLGFIIGEVRGWEFGSEPCGWVFAFSVEPETRLLGIGERLFDDISARFRAAGIRTMRTMVARDNQLHMAFFRSEGMVAGPYIQLEKSLDD